jgi:hypothetical protein
LRQSFKSAANPELKPATAAEKMAFGGESQGDA